MHYPAQFEPDPGGGFVVTFRDIPEAITQGETESEAIDMAADALLTAMDFYFEDGRQVPMPSKPEKNDHLVALSAGVWAKVLLLNEMLAQKVGPSELARRIGSSPQAFNRVMDIHHSTKIDTIAEAFGALGKNLELRVS